MSNTGIYLIKNIKNNKIYVGSASGRGFKSRWVCHKSLLRRNKHHSIHLQRAWNKDGENSFVFIILEYCSPQECINREQFYLDSLLPEYNICKIANSRLGIKLNKVYTLTKEHKEKLSLAAKKRGILEDTQLAAWAACRGRKHTEQEKIARKKSISKFWNSDRSAPHKERARVLGLSNKGIAKSAEQIEKMSADSPNKKRIRCFNKVSNETREFCSAKEAAKILHLKYNQISRAANKLRPHYKNWVFDYIK